MSINVYAWPPVYAVGAEWTEVAPVQISRSIITGAEYSSAAQRIRRYATVEVRGIGVDRNGAGYMEALKRYLAGINAVRLYSYPINWYVDALRNDVARSAVLLNWLDGATDLEWVYGAEDLIWLDGEPVFATTITDDDGYPALRVVGMQPNALAVKPGEFITIFEADGVTKAETVQAVKPAYSDANGDTEIRIFSVTGSYTGRRVNIGSQDSAVFKPVGAYPRAVQPISGDWSYTWGFREVFADEVGGFVELDPWH